MNILNKNKMNILNKNIKYGNPNLGTKLYIQHILSLIITEKLKIKE